MPLNGNLSCTHVQPHYGIRTKEYKLIHFYNDIDQWELYDLKNDPDEMKNLYSNPKQADLIKQLKEKLIDLRKQYNDTTGKEFTLK